MVRILSILARRCRLFADHNRLMLLILYLAFFTTINSAQPRPSPSTSTSNSPLSTPTTKAPNPAPPPTAAPHQCNIELSTSWCPPNQTCFITSTTFQCAPTTATTTAGWTITPHLNIIFFNPTNSSSLLLLPSGGECLLLPVPTQNSTHLKILILALKQHDVYYRTSTILISDDPMAIVRGVSSCKNPQERCVEGRCVPVLGYGEVCEGNDECYNPPRAFNSTTYYNPNLKDDESPQQDDNGNGNGNGGEPLGRVCDYEPGKLDSPPKCIDYIRVHDRPDTDQHIIPPAEQKRKLNWIFAIVVLVVIILFVLLFMCWRKTHGSSRSDGEDDLPQEQQQMHYQQLQQRYQSYNGDLEDGVKGGGGGGGGGGDRKYKDTTDYLSTNYLKGLSAAGGSGPGQGMGGRRGSTGSQTSAHSNISWGNTRRLSVAENMVMSRRDRDHALDHEFMNMLSQSRPLGSIHRIEQLATSSGHSIGGGGGGVGVGPMSMEPGRRSMSFDPMQVYPTTAPYTGTNGGGGRGGSGGGGRGRVHELQRQDPSPPPNTPESQLPETMPVV